MVQQEHTCARPCSQKGNGIYFFIKGICYVVKTAILWYYNPSIQQFISNNKAHTQEKNTNYWEEKRNITTHKIFFNINIFSFLQCYLLTNYIFKINTKIHVLLLLLHWYRWLGVRKDMQPAENIAATTLKGLFETFQRPQAIATACDNINIISAHVLKCDQSPPSDFLIMITAIIKTCHVTIYIHVWAAMLPRTPSAELGVESLVTDV